MLAVRILFAAFGAFVLFVIFSLGVAGTVADQALRHGSNGAMPFPDADSDPLADMRARAEADDPAEYHRRQDEARARRDGVTFEPGAPMVDTDPNHRR